MAVADLTGTILDKINALNNVTNTNGVSTFYLI